MRLTLIAVISELYSSFILRVTPASCHWPAVFSFPPEDMAFEAASQLYAFTSLTCVAMLPVLSCWKVSERYDSSQAVSWRFMERVDWTLSNRPLRSSETEFHYPRPYFSLIHQGIRKMAQFSCCFRPRAIDDDEVVTVSKVARSSSS